MKILITGGSGFLGAALARELLRQPTLALEGRGTHPLTQLILTDRVAPPADLVADARVQGITGDLFELIQSKTLGLSGVDAIVHLAAAVSGECEADLDLGLHSNLNTSLALLQAARHAGQRPVFVFPSSVAVFGAPAGSSLPTTITDTTLPTPQNSYGTQKFMVEQLVADYSRRGLVHGRNVRLMTVSIRAGQPNGAASGFLSGMLREPLAGLPSVVPVPPETAVALASPESTIAGLMAAITTPAAIWGPPQAVNFPSISTTVGDMALALKDMAGPAVADKLSWTPDAKVQAIVASWPSRFETLRAQALGLPVDASVHSIIQAYASAHPHAVSCNLTSLKP